MPEPKESRGEHGWGNRRDRERKKENVKISFGRKAYNTSDTF